MMFPGFFLMFFRRQTPRSFRWSGGFAALLLAFLSPYAAALDVTGYTSEANDRFSSGYASDPVDNTSSSFVAAGYDLSGVGWATANTTKSFALLSPKHYLFASHYGGASSLTFAGSDGELYSYTTALTESTAYGTPLSGATTGDISLGTLTTSVNTTAVTPYAILDNVTYTTNTSVLFYGRGNSASASSTDSPILGETTLTGMNTTGTNSYLQTSRDDVQLEGGDSGSPAFLKWTDPNGNAVLTIVGNNSAIDTTNGYNYLNYLGSDSVISALNTLMKDDGYALRFVADPTATFKGGTFTRAQSWSASVSLTSGSAYLGFDADNVTAANRSVSITSAASVRGLVFNPGAAGFTFSGSGTMSLGRGGIANYDTHSQTLGNNFLLTESQYWDGMEGGLAVTGAIDTNGYLLIAQGSGALAFGGVISGTGSLAKDGTGVMTLSGSNTYTGKTYLHNGTLLANNTKGSATGSGAVVAEAGTLAGYGTISGSTQIQNGVRLTAGSIASTGAAPTLSAADQTLNNLSFGGNLTLNGSFDFYLGSLSETAGFTQVLMEGSSALLTLGNTSSFTLSLENFLGIADPNSSAAFWTSDHSWVLFDLGASAAIAGTFGTVSLGDWSNGVFTLSYDGGDTGNDIVLTYTADVETVPEPSTLLLVSSGLALAGFAFRHRRPR